MVEFDIKLERFRDKETGRLVSGRMFKNIGHAAASLMKDARRSISNSKRASRPGRPPNTRRGLFRRAIRFEMGSDRKSAAVGFIESLVGQSAKAQEFGGRYKEQNYPERPTMGPALERNKHRFAGQFAGRIGG